MSAEKFQKTVLERFFLQEYSMDYGPELFASKVKLTIPRDYLPKYYMQNVFKKVNGSLKLAFTMYFCCQTKTFRKDVCGVFDPKITRQEKFVFLENIKKEYIFCDDELIISLWFLLRNVQYPTQWTKIESKMTTENLANQIAQKLGLKN